MTINYNSVIKFTETKKGSYLGKEFNNTAGGYIQAVRASSVNADEFQQMVTNGHDFFDDLSVEAQLNICVSVNDSACASSTRWEVESI